MARNTIQSISPVSQSIDGGVFRIKRPIITTNGVSTAVDAVVDGHFQELAGLLAKGAFGARTDKNLVASVTAIVSRPLTPKFSPPKPPASTYSATHAAAKGQPAATNGQPATAAAAIEWADNSLAATLDAAPAAGLTLSDFIDITPTLSDLKYAYEQSLSGNWLLLDANVRFALNRYPSLRDYLVVYTVLVMQVKDFNALKNFILNNQSGVRNIINYAAVGAARDYVFNQKLVVDQYNDDDTPFAIEIKAANLSLTDAAFTPALKNLIDDVIFNAAQTTILAAATIKVPDALRANVIQLMKKSAVPLTTGNIDFFLPLLISQLSPTPLLDDPGTTDTTVSDQDFSVEFLQDTTAIAQVSRSAVLCSAQLFYDMVLGDELDVFSTVNYFTHNYLLRGAIEIQDGTLRNDLQLYVFSNKFTDLRTNRVNDRTARPNGRCSTSRCSTPAPISATTIWRKSWCPTPTIRSSGRC